MDRVAKNAVSPVIAGPTARPTKWANNWTADRILNPAQVAATNSKRADKMSSNLKKIQNLAASVRDSLASLKPSSGLDDLDTIARERSVLREKLDLLADAESEERGRLEAEAAAAKAKQRVLLLKNVAAKAETASENYQQLTDQAVSLVGDLVATLAERERAFSRDELGLNESALFDLLSNDERLSLLESLERSVIGVYPGDFGNTWREAVFRNSAHKSVTRRTLLQLVTAPGQYQDSSLSGVRPLVAEAVRQMVGDDHTAGSVVDLRSN